LKNTPVGVALADVREGIKIKSRLAKNPDGFILQIEFDNEFF
jgi:hypothetical protein